MNSETVIRSLFRSLEATLHERLRMIEDVILLGSMQQEGEQAPAALQDRISAFEEALTNITSRITALESDSGSVSGGDTVHVNRIGMSSTPRSPPGQGLWVSAMKDLEIVLPPAPAPLPIAVPCAPVAVAPPSAAVAAVAPQPRVASPAPTVASPQPMNTTEDQQSAIEHVEEEEMEVEEEVEEEEEEEAEEEEEEEEEEEGEAVELEEFQFKNTTYYRDGQNQVYGLDADGELKEEPIGTWDVARQRVLFKRVA